MINLYNHRCHMGSHERESWLQTKPQILETVLRSRYKQSPKLGRDLLRANSIKKQNCIPSQSHICCSGRSTDLCNSLIGKDLVHLIPIPTVSYIWGMFSEMNKSEESSLACSCQLPLKIELNKQNGAALKHIKQKSPPFFSRARHSNPRPSAKQDCTSSAWL